MRPSSSLAGVVLTASIFLMGASAPRDGQLTGQNQSSNATAEPNRRVHTVGDVWMNIGSDGRLGTYVNANGAEPDSTYLIPVSFEFPGGSRREHLFGSGLLIGGLVGGVDTLVMAAMEATSHSNSVFRATLPLRTGYDPTLGHQSFVAHYADTGQAASRYPYNRSLGVEIRQTSHAFESPPYDRFVIVEYLIRNISRQTIHRVHVGFFADPDVINESGTGQPESGPTDDLTGFLRDRGVAYTIDNDGDARGMTDSLFAQNWCPSGFGLAPVMMDPLPTCTSFNWWATNFGNVEWGPSRTVPVYNYIGVGAPTIPVTMPQLYRAMANREIDYDQLEAAIDKREQGWNRPSIAGAPNIANGLDTRWTLSYCFGDLAPYDSLRIVMAYVAGDSIHTTPDRYPDPRYPDMFAAGLDFSDLRQNVDLARWAWGRLFSLDGASPLGLRAEAVADRIVRISWRMPPSNSISGFRLQRRVVSDPDWVRLVEVPDTVLSWYDSTVTTGVDYEYFVTALYEGNDGSASKSVVVSPGQPPVIPELRGKNTPEAVGITWSAEKLAQGFSDIRFLNLYRSTDRDTVPRLHERFYWPDETISSRESAHDPSNPASAIRFRDPLGMQPFSFIDHDVASGVTYSYRASVTNDLGLEGERSNEISVTPMQLDRRGIIVIHMDDRYEGALRDSVLQFYGRWAEHYGFDTVVSFRGNPPVQDKDTIPSMDALSHYQCAILVMENTRAVHPVQPLSSSLEQYASNSGRVVVIQRSGGILNEYWSPMPAYPILRRFLGIRTLRLENFRGYPIVGFGPSSKYLVARFESAESYNPAYPDLDGDSARGWDSWFMQASAPFVDSVYGRGNVPAVGALDSLEPDTEILYRYNSAYDTSVYHGKPIGVRRITDSSAAILFNFPLSLMKHEQAWQALTQAVTDLGIDTVNYSLPPTSITRSMIEWLYGKSADAPSLDWDLNRDDVIDIRDAVESLQRR